MFWSHYEKQIMLFAFMDGITPERALKRIQDFKDYVKKVEKLRANNKTPNSKSEGMD